jgi:uncharacterized protein Smg (DUF494 family)
MRERIVDIVTWAVIQMQQNKFDKSQLNSLEEKGFTPKEISIAFSWLSDKFDTQTPNEFILAITNPPQSFRVFTDEEKSFFTDEAYSTIIKLMSAGLIRHFHIDMIIEKAEMVGLYKINNDMVRQFVAYYMFDVPTPAENTIRFNFCGNESVN